MKKLLILLALLALALPDSAHAGRLKQGMQELSINADFASRDVDGGLDFDLNTINVEYGMFVGKDLQVGGLLDYLDLPDIDVKLTTFAAEIKYHINSGADTIPYIGGLAGVTLIDAPPNDDTEVSIGFMVGVKHFTSNSASFNAQFRHLKAGDFTASDLTFGLSIYFMD